MGVKQTEALKLALEALEESLGYVQEEAKNAQRLYGQYPTRQARIQGLKDDARKHMDAITAIREALAEQLAQRGPVQEIARLHDRIKDLEQDVEFLSRPAQQEPVAYINPDDLKKMKRFGRGSVAWATPTDFCTQPVYTSPPASKPLSSLTEDNIPAFPWVSQKPVAWMHTNAIGHVYFRKNPQDKTLNPVPLYTSPPARKPWMGLTDEEMKAVHRNAGVTYLVPADYDRHLFTHMTDVQLMKISKVIEAKLKEKNNG